MSCLQASAQNPFRQERGYGRGHVTASRRARRRYGGRRKCAAYSPNARRRTNASDRGGENRTRRNRERCTEQSATTTAASSPFQRAAFPYRARSSTPGSVSAAAAARRRRHRCRREGRLEPAGRQAPAPDPTPRRRTAAVLLTAGTRPATTAAITQAGAATARNSRVAALFRPPAVAALPTATEPPRPNHKKTPPSDSSDITQAAFDAFKRSRNPSYAQ